MLGASSFALCGGNLQFSAVNAQERLVEEIPEFNTAGLQYL